MNIILLSGGSGKRLWPLSNDVRSKQFLEVFKRPDGTYESMVQRMSRMINEVDPDSSVTFATSGSQVESIRKQLGDKVGISIEPCRRDTFPAIALSVAYLKDVMGLPEDEAVVVCPVDPFVEHDYFLKIKELHALAEKSSSNLVLLGIEPSSPSEKFGYIIPQSKEEISRVETFKEKPDKATAEKYIEMGALWNAGVFSFKLRYVLDIAKKEFGFCSYDELFNNYASLRKISFDYAVVEKENNIQVVRFSGKWKDLGTWDSLSNALNYNVSGNVILADSEDTHVINELKVPVLALGVRNLAIVTTPDGILVTDKDASDKLKNYVPDGNPMFEKKIWGEYRVIDIQEESDNQSYCVKSVTVSSGFQVKSQDCLSCDTTLVFLSGKGTITIDGVASAVMGGQTREIHKGAKYEIAADSELQLIEIQFG